MQEKDILTRKFLNDNERFADIINATAFSGEQVLDAAHLHDVDRTEAALVGRIKSKFAVTKYRDVVKKWENGEGRLIVAGENQMCPHYLMPARVMVYDALTYDSQISDIRKEHIRKKDLKKAEYLSGFSKEDRMTAVLTVVLYYGKEPWDGARNIRELLDMRGLPECVKREIPDYPIRIVDVRRLDNLEQFKSDAGAVFGFLKYENSKKELQEFIYKNRERFSRIAEDAYDMITELSNSGELDAVKEEVKVEGGYDMCEALKEMMEDSRTEGEDMFAALTQRLVEDARTTDLLRAASDKKYREILYKEYNLTTGKD